MLHRVFGFVESAHIELDRMRRNEVAPDVGRILDAPHRFGGNALLLLADEVPIEIRFGFASRLFALVHDVERVEIPIRRVDAVCGEPATEAVAAIMHQCDGLQNVAPVVESAAFIHDSRNGAPGRNPDIAFA